MIEVPTGWFFLGTLLLGFMGGFLFAGITMIWSRNQDINEQLRGVDDLRTEVEALQRMVARQQIDSN